METLITDINLLESGDQVLIKTPFGDNHHAMVIHKHAILKYSIESEGRKCRSHDGGFVYADECGHDGTESINAVDLVSVGSEGGSFHFDEDTENVEEWNIRKISEDHPSFDKKVSEVSSKVSSMLDRMADYFEAGN